MIAFFLKSKYSYQLNFYDNLKKLIKTKATNLRKIKEKEEVFNTMSELYNKRFKNDHDGYNELSNVGNLD